MAPPAARRVPGVHAVLTGFDIPHLLVGRMLRDIPILARDVVRSCGWAPEGRRWRLRTRTVPKKPYLYIG